jgi:hypothetical protein
MSAAGSATAKRNRAWRPVAALAALFLGLGVAGTAAGAALGTVRAAPTDSRPGYGHHRGNDAQRFPSVGR